MVDDESAEDCSQQSNPITSDRRQGANGNEPAHEDRHSERSECLEYCLEHVWINRRSSLSVHRKRHAVWRNNCINTQIGPVNLGTRCAFSMIDTDSSTGLITGSTMTFPPESSTWPQAFNDRLAAHELGHHGGLEENLSSCGTINSLMRPVACGASSGFPTAPTTSDHLPVARTTYQGQTTSTCQ
jgi:hypothetical protein